MTQTGKTPEAKGDKHVDSNGARLIVSGLRCAVCRDRFVAGDSIQVIGNVTAVLTEDGVQFPFNVNDDMQQELCAVHSTCCIVVLLYKHDDEQHQIIVDSEERNGQEED